MLGPLSDVEAHNMAQTIMGCGDWHLRNGRLTVSEMRTGLQGTPHQAFGEWLSAPQTKDCMWKKYDVDMDGGLDLSEVAMTL